MQASLSEFYRFRCVLPIILTDALSGDMGAKAEAIAELAWELRGLVQFFLRNPTFHTRHVDSAVVSFLFLIKKDVSS